MKPTNLRVLKILVSSTIFSRNRGVGTPFAVHLAVGLAIIYTLNHG